MSKLPSIPVMQRAFANKDSQYDGVFFVGVKTTGIFCRPVCHAKPAKPDNLEFFGSADAAVREGYRACKLCKPDRAAAPPALVAKLMETMKQNPDERLTADRLREMKIDPSTARRQFKRFCGLTFAAYQRSQKLGGAVQSVKQGRRKIAAQLQAGYESASGFREAFARHLGTTTMNAQDVKSLTMKWLPSPLGQMLAVASDDGIVLCDFFDRRDIESAVQHVRERFGGRTTPAAISPGDHRYLAKIEDELKRYFEGTLRDFTVALAPAGSEFEMKSWNFLRQIPYGETRSYGQQAKAIGLPDASRAVGRANGMNFIAILIPCHRVIGANGKLTGYGGGVARKQWLLDHERGCLFR